MGGTARILRTQLSKNRKELNGGSPAGGNCKYGRGLRSGPRLGKTKTDKVRRDNCEKNFKKALTTYHGSGTMKTTKGQPDRAGRKETMVRRETHNYDENRETVNFENVIPIYTGGGIYIFLGKIEGGNWFYACDSWFDIRTLDADPNAPDPNGDYEFIGDDPDWQEAHKVEDLDDPHYDIFEDMLNWIIENKPEGGDCNYQLGDMENDLLDIERLREERA